MRLTLCMFGIVVLDLTLGPNDQASEDDAADCLTIGSGFGFNPDVRYDAVPGGETT